MSDIKMSDRPLWIDKNGHRTLDNWSKQEMSYHHCEDVKCLREDNDTLAAQVAELRGRLSDCVNDYIKHDKGDLTPSVFHRSAVALEGESNE